MTVTHGFEPVYDKNSRILILGSFPSVLSRENGFYYGHPCNRFWPLLARLLGEPCPTQIADKKALLLRHGIALWDVVQSCEITGSSDASIRSVIPNPVGGILCEAPVERICANGRTAHTLFLRHLQPSLARDCMLLPSTSPANAAWSLDRLEAAWRAALQ